jgi:hypothetical protein
MRFRRRFTLLSALLLLSVLGGINPAAAAPPYVSPEQVKERAQVILTGKVNSIRTRDEERADRSKDRIVLLQVAVGAVEKGGDLIKPGDVITIRCWRLVRPQWVEGYPEGWIETHGTGFIPSEGGSAKFFLRAKSDDGWFPVFPGEGVVRVDDTPSLEFPMEPVEPPAKTVKDPGKPVQQAAGAWLWPYGIVAGVVGAAVLLLAVWLVVSRSRKRGLEEPRRGEPAPPGPK